MNLINELRQHIRLWGVSGVVALASHKILSVPKEASVPYKGKPIRLRIGSTDRFVYQHVLLQPQYEATLPSTVPQIIIDAGANIGLSAIYFAYRYPAAKIFAIEPEQSNFDLLRRNVSAFPNITPIHAALWSNDGLICVHPPEDSGAFGDWGFVTSQREGTQVRSVSVPTLMRELNCSRIDLFKIDIEGAEKEVFESCNWQGSVGTIVIELHDRFKTGCSAAVKNALQGWYSYSAGELTVFNRHDNSGSPDQESLATSKAELEIQ